MYRLQILVWQSLLKLEVPHCSHASWVHLITWLVCLDLLQFEDVLRQPDPRENLPKLVDPRLGDDYPLDSVCKVKFDHRKSKFLQSRPVSLLKYFSFVFCSQMAQLARACTQEIPQLIKTKHEMISCGSNCDTFIHNWRLGCWFILW